MGRSSGGGGGGRSGGGFSGGHSSGGFSGGGRSSRHSTSGFSHSGGVSHMPGNYHHGGYGPGPARAPRPPRPPRTPRTHIFWGPRPPRYHGYYGGTYHRTPGFFTYLIIFIIFIIIISGFTSIRRNNNYTIVESTKQRQALSGVVNKTDWYDDNIGWITNKNVLIDGLEDFYKETGIQPYVLFVPYSSEYWNGTNFNSTAGDAYLEKVYSDTFIDEGHFIFAYFQCANDSKSEMEGEFRYLSGHSADTIMDSEAISIFWGYFEKNYYNTSLSIEKMISNTFSETAKAIMSKPTNGWDFAKVLIVAIVIIIVIIIIYSIFKNKNKRDKEKEEYTKEILNTPLETFGKDTSDIEKKYE